MHLYNNLIHLIIRYPEVSKHLIIDLMTVINKVFPEASGYLIKMYEVIIRCLEALDALLRCMRLSIRCLESLDALLRCMRLL